MSEQKDAQVLECFEVSSEHSTSNTAAEPVDQKVTEEPLDPTKDVKSELFDPMQALYADDVCITKKKPPVQFQNLAAFDSALKKHGVWGLQQKGNEPAAGTSKKNKKEPTTATTRRFLPHQMPIQAPAELRHFHRNLNKYFDQIEGPLRLLVVAMKAAKQVRVVVRNERGVRGYMNGTIICFDKHWNLLLKDVLEVWCRRKFKYGVNKTCEADNPAQDCSAVLEELGIILPQQSVKSLNRKNVEITRKLTQLFIRGEHVVLVNILENESENKLN